MTKVKLHAPVAEMHGEFEKNSGIIMRQKKYRAPNGFTRTNNPYHR